MSPSGERGTSAISRFAQQSLYGIELEEEKVSWRNPDMIGKSAKKLPDGSEERRK